MTSTFTPNKGYQLQGTGDNPNTWGIALNANVFSVMDSNIGATLNISVAGSSDVTITASQAQNINHVLTGLLTGNINYIFPASQGGFFIIDNQTTGSFTVTAKPSGGTGIVIPQGKKMLVFINGSTNALSSMSDTFSSGPESTLASATTTDLGTAPTNLINITGTTTITGFGSNARTGNPLYFVRFAGILQLTYNVTSMVLPTSANITTAAGDTAIFEYLGSGNWRCIFYQRFSGAALLTTSTAEATIASASTTDLGSAGTTTILVSGTTTITAFGSSASLTSPIYVVRFSGSLTLTYNASSLILPGSANIVTQNGDAMIAEYLGSGNWKVLLYQKQTPIVPFTVVRRQIFPSSGTYTPNAFMLYCDAKVYGGGGGGGGVDATSSAAGGGGGSGGFSQKVFSAATIGASQTVTIGAGGTAGANTGGAGGTGGTTSLGALLTAGGGSGGVGVNVTGNSVAGGTGGTGSIEGNATVGMTGQGTFASGTIASSASGSGGSTNIGGGGTSRNGSTSGGANGANGTANSGGGGGGALSGGSAQTGGVGGSGFVIITEYCSQ